MSVHVIDGQGASSTVRVDEANGLLRGHGPTRWFIVCEGVDLAGSHASIAELCEKNLRRFAPGVRVDWARMVFRVEVMQSISDPEYRGGREWTPAPQPFERKGRTSMVQYEADSYVCKRLLAAGFTGNAHLSGGENNHLVYDEPLEAEGARSEVGGRLFNVFLEAPRNGRARFHVAERVVVDAVDEREACELGAARLRTDFNKTHTVRAVAMEDDPVGAAWWRLSSGVDRVSSRVTQAMCREAAALGTLWLVDSHDGVQRLAIAASEGQAFESIAREFCWSELWDEQKADDIEGFVREKGWRARRIAASSASSN